jgi:hypothetical protein
LDSAEELVEVDPEMLEEHREGGDRRGDATSFDGTDEGPGERRRDGCLAQLGGSASSPELSTDGVRQPLFVRWRLINS